MERPLSANVNTTYTFQLQTVACLHPESHEPGHIVTDSKHKEVKITLVLSRGEWFKYLLKLQIVQKCNFNVLSLVSDLYDPKV